MSRLLVLVPTVLWFLWLDVAEPAHAQPMGLALFLAGLLVTVLTAAYAAVRSARGGREGSGMAGFLGALHRLALPVLLAWFGVGLFALGWGDAALALTDLAALPALRTPGLALATLPAYGAWALLMAAEYPAARQRRESRVLEDIEDGLPIYVPPPALRYWSMALRQRLLFALVPLLLLMAARDAAVLSLWAAGAAPSERMETWLFVGSALLVIAVSPELVRRLLPTRPLAPGALRDRLERLCTRTGLPMRDILVWNTGGSMVNAAVVGFMPGMRYVLLTDLLLDSMTPVQIEAVFAHEVGHVKHRHLLWYFIFLAGMTLLFAGPVEALWRALAPRFPLAGVAGTTVEYVIGIGSLVLVFGLFGLLSRCFERQADVFAARMMQAQVDEAAASVVPGPGTIVAGPVGFAGADIFGSSLRRAAKLNHLPLEVARKGRGPLALFNRATDQLAHFLHGTIGSRIEYLEHLARRPRQTYRFDISIVAVKLGVILVTAGSASFLAWN